jgi:hypothetical protein
MDETCSTHGEINMHTYPKAVHLWVLMQRLQRIIFRLVVASDETEAVGKNIFDE